MTDTNDGPARNWSPSRACPSPGRRSSRRRSSASRRRRRHANVELTPERAAQVVRQSSNARWVGFLAVVVVILFITVYWFYELAPLGFREPRLDAEANSQQVTSVERGYNLYEANCARCHGANGEGGIGPTLNSQEKLYAHLSVDYLNNMLVAGGRYACGDVNSVMPVWSNQGHPPGPLNYVQIDDLISFIRAPSNETYTIRDPSLGEPKIDPLTGRGPDLQRLGRRQLQARPGLDAVPGLLEGPVRDAVRIRRPPAASIDPNATVVKIAASGIKFDTDDADRTGRQGLRHRVRQPGRGHPAQHRDQGLGRRGQVHRRDLQRRRDAALPGARPGGRQLPVPVHRAPDDDGDTDHSVISPSAGMVGG